jgi:hypothetical protein
MLVEIQLSIGTYSVSKEFESESILPTEEELCDAYEIMIHEINDMIEEGEEDEYYDYEN